MIWRKDGRWLGPFRIIIQDGRHVVWASLGNKLFRAAPEQVRPVTAVEEVQYKDQMEREPRAMLDPENIPKNFQDLGTGHSPEVIPDENIHMNPPNYVEEAEADAT